MEELLQLKQKVYITIAQSVLIESERHENIIFRHKIFFPTRECLSRTFSRALSSKICARPI